MGSRFSSRTQNASSEAGAASMPSRLSCGSTARVGAVPSTCVNIATWPLILLYCCTVLSGAYCVSCWTSSTWYLPAIPPFSLLT